jgi:hypothetical protein
MHFQIVVTPQTAIAPPSLPAPEPAVPNVADLLRQILEVQRELLSLQRAAAAAHDSGARWRTFLARWQRDFPDLGDGCRFALPVIEKAYGGLIADLAGHIRQSGTDALDNDFTLAEFLDRYGMRLSQLGTILSLVAFLAEAANSAASGEPT